MARTINEQEYAFKRNEILAVARRLVYTKGYEQMTIQAMLTELGISKGAFYHYFASKEAVLEGLIELMQREGEQLVGAILADPTLPPLVKLQRYFDTANRWKVGQKEYLLALLRVWYTDDNAIVRQKIQATLLQFIAPQLTAVIIQGHREGIFTTPFPEHAAVILVNLMVGIGDLFANLLLSSAHNPDGYAHAEQTVAAYNDALERILGAPSGSLCLIDAPTLQQWFAPRAHEAGPEVISPALDQPRARGAQGAAVRGGPRRRRLPAPREDADGPALKASSESVP